MKNKKTIITLTLVLLCGIFLTGFVSPEVYGSNSTTPSCMVCPTCAVCQTPTIIDETSCGELIKDSNSSKGLYQIGFLILGLLIGFFGSKKFGSKKKDQKTPKIENELSKELNKRIEETKENRETKENSFANKILQKRLQLKKENDTKERFEEHKIKVQDEELNGLIDSLGLGEGVKERFKNLNE